MTASDCLGNGIQMDRAKVRLGCKTERHQRVMRDWRSQSSLCSRSCPADTSGQWTHQSRIERRKKTLVPFRPADDASAESYVTGWTQHCQAVRAVIRWTTEAPKRRGWSRLAPIGRRHVRSHAYTVIRSLAWSWHLCRRR